MFPRSHKVAKHMLPLIQRTGKQSHSKNLVLKAIRTETDEKNGQNIHFGFVVSNKISKKAVERNRIRRRGYAILKNELKHIEDSYTCVLYAKKGIQGISYTEFAKEIHGLLKQAKIIT